MTTMITLPAMRIDLRLEPAGPAQALRTEGGQIVADIPAGLAVSPRGAARLFAAWLRQGRSLDWREATRTLGSEGGQ